MGTQSSLSLPKNNTSNSRTRSSVLTTHQKLPDSHRVATRCVKLWQVCPTHTSTLRHMERSQSLLSSVHQSKEQTMSHAVVAIMIVSSCLMSQPSQTSVRMISI